MRCKRPIFRRKHGKPLRSLLFPLFGPARVWPHDPLDPFRVFRHSGVHARLALVAALGKPERRDAHLHERVRLGHYLQWTAAETLKRDNNVCGAATNERRTYRTGVLAVVRRTRADHAVGLYAHFQCRPVSRKIRLVALVGRHVGQEHFRQDARLGWLACKKHTTTTTTTIGERRRKPCTHARHAHLRAVWENGRRPSVATLKTYCTNAGPMENYP